MIVDVVVVVDDSSEAERETIEYLFSWCYCPTRATVSLITCFDGFSWTRILFKLPVQLSCDYLEESFKMSIDKIRTILIQ